MKYRLSFGTVEVLSENVAEVIIDEGVEISLEMCEEYDHFILEIFPHPYSIIVNRVNNFSYTFEAGLQFSSMENEVATAVIVYNKQSELNAYKFMDLRKQDNLNVKVFSALDLGRRKSIEWAESELSKVTCL